MNKTIMVLCIAVLIFSTAQAHQFLMPNSTWTESSDYGAGLVNTTTPACRAYANLTAGDEICAVWPKQNVDAVCTSGICYQNLNLNITCRAPVVNVSAGTLYYLRPTEPCIKDPVSNNTYCSAWMKLNVNMTLLPSQVWNNADINVTLTGANLAFKAYNMSVNTTLDDLENRVHVECAKDGLIVQNVTKDMEPGSSWFNIRCLPLLSPLNGTIYLEGNTTFNETWNFTTKAGTCLVNVSPTGLFMQNLDFANKYSYCNADKEDLRMELNNTLTIKDRYSIVLIMIILAAGFFAFMWIREMRGGQIISSPSTPKLRLKASPSEPVEYEVPKKNVDYLIDKYNLKGRQR